MHLSTFRHAAVYAVRHRKPIVITTLRLKLLSNKIGNGVCSLINTDALYGGLDDTYLYHHDYIKCALEVNDQRSRQFMNDKENVLKRCSDMLGRDFLIMSESEETDILDFIRRHPKLVAKVNESMGGRGVRVYDTEGKAAKSVLRKIKRQGADILEGYVQQHSAVNEIYPGAVNTIRVHTVNTGDEVRCFIDPSMSVGADGSKTNMSLKRYTFNINRDGTLKDVVFSDGAVYKKAEYHKDTGKRFDEVKLPFMDEMYELVKSAAKRCPETKYIGWDVAISQDGPVIIEGNGCSGAFNGLQDISMIYHGHGCKKEILEMLNFALET